MRIESLNIKHVRIIEEASLRSDASFVYLYGDNGSGKTSVLEAINLLATGQSFRSTTQKNIIRHGNTSLRIRASVRLDKNTELHNIGLEKHRNGSRTIRHNQENVKRITDLASFMPIRTVTPDSHALINGSPLLRRKYMDWGVFHVEQSLDFPWREYGRLLAQRNSLLKSCWDKNQIAAIDNLFCPLAEAIASAREKYCQRINALLPEILDSLDSSIDFQVKHAKGWAKDEIFSIALDSHGEQCRRFKTTTVGPHRADLQLLTHGKLAKDVLSRGQQKLMLYALTLAQVTDFHRKQNKHIILLCDDLQSELDGERTDKLVKTLLEQGHQLFVTGVTKLPLKFDSTQSMFHVKHGKVEKDTHEV